MEPYNATFTLVSSLNRDVNDGQSGLEAGKEKEKGGGHSGGLQQLARLKSGGAFHWAPALSNFSVSLRRIKRMVIQ